MKNKYIFASDIDGTILDDLGKPHPETLKAIKEARKNNHIIVLATGRSLSRIQPILPLLNNEIDYLICNNGTLIFDCKKNEIVFLKPIKPYLFEEIFSFAKKHSVYFTLHTDKASYNYPSLRTSDSIILENNKIEKIINFSKEFPEKNHIYSGETITQLSINSSNDFCLKYLKEFETKYGNDYSVCIANGIFLDVNPKNISKWSGLLEIANKLNIDKNKIVTFGDSGNDYEMIKNSGDNGYALENSTDDLKSKIEPKIGSNNTDAIAKIIFEKIQE
ncbi:MAG: Cof-type HAD-IIB family hydrolase [Metamycoplasmataceae bacterium]